MDISPATPGSRRTGRRPGRSCSRQDILAAARYLFAERGFEATSLRAISRRAGVDPALVHHFFGGKEEVFRAALADIMKVEQIFEEALVDDPLTGMGERLVLRFLCICEQETTRAPLLAMLRSAVSHPRSAELLRQFMHGALLRQMAEGAEPRDAELRAALVCSQLIGLALLRYVLGTPPLATADPGQIARSVGPTLELYFFGPVSPCVGGGRA